MAGSSMSATGSLVGGAVLGTVFNALYESLKHLGYMNHIYKALVNDIQISLNALRPLIREIVECNSQLTYCSKEEVQGLEQVLREGNQLVGECLNISRWKPFKKYKYARKLLKWDESLKRQLDILKVQETRDVKKIAVGLRSLEAMMDHMIQIQYSSGSSSNHTTLQLPQLPTLMVGLDVPLRELKGKLLTDDGESMLVLTAPGGCGKTTLATMFCQDQQVKDKFGPNIIFITVSQKGSLDLIVKQLCDHQSSQGSQLVPKFQNEVQVGQWLRRYFSERIHHHPILLVLDDVWSGSESILGSFQFELSNYKILVTSRSEFPWFATSYHLPLLDYRNAMKLFQHYASLGDGTSLIPEELSTKIVKRCNGFPLAITIVGRSLCKKPIEFWRKTEAEWAKGSSIRDSETKLFLGLESSLDALDEDMALVKECFFDLGSFPEDYRIPLATLFEMWVELYGLDEHSMCIANVYELRTRTLANLIDHREVVMEGDDFYDERFVTQHDLLRELAIYHAKLDPVERRKRVIIEISGNKLPKWWREGKYPMQARLLSISTDRWFSMECQWPNLHAPVAQVLVLNFQTKSYQLPKFVGEMNNLKVLVIAKDDYQTGDISNFDLLGSSSSLKSIRLEAISIACITRNPIQLNSLKKISFYKCVIGLTFSSEIVKMSDAFPVLEEMNVQECKYLGNLLPELCDMIQLKKLSITDTSDIETLPEEFGNLVNLEVLRLRSCYDLLKLPSSVKNLKKLQVLDIFNCISITELPPSIGDLSSLRRLNMKWCFKMKELPLSVFLLDELEEVICDEDTKPLWVPLLDTLRKTRIVAT